MELPWTALRKTYRITEIETIKPETDKQNQRYGYVNNQFSAEEKRGKKEMVQQEQKQIG